MWITIGAIVFFIVGSAFLVLVASMLSSKISQEEIDDAEMRREVLKLRRRLPR